ncbi:MAG: PRD domain-containing protein [bacterium]|nr:PRD domain-containing protein [bacterium]
MYRVKKVLNHNAVIAVQLEDNCEYMIMGKGAGFGKKVAERVEARPEDTVYSLQKNTERGDARELARTISPVCLEIANEILNEAEKTFKKIDRSIFFPMADHIEFAVKRIKNREQISNPLTDDIRVLFHMEYKVAQQIQPILREKLGIEIEDDEVGYVALHIHSAIEDEKVSQAMQTAMAVRECISLVEEEAGRKIDIMSLSYNRLMNHVRYMVERTVRGEKLKLNMNDYMKIKFPDSYQMAESVCKKISKSIHCELDSVEIGYLALHIERVLDDETEIKK